MGLNDPACKCKAKTSAALLECDKGLKNGTKSIRRNTASGIRDADLKSFFCPVCFQGDCADEVLSPGSGRRLFQNRISCIGKQIQEYLPEFDRICRQDRKILCDP